MEQGGEEALLPAVGDGREAAGSCDPKENPDTRIRFFYTFRNGTEKADFCCLCEVKTYLSLFLSQQLPQKQKKNQRKPRW